MRYRALTYGETMIKTGVRVFGMRPEIVLALMIAKDVYTMHGQAAAFVVTSVMEGAHSRASIHYTGGAADLRRPVIKTAEIVADLKLKLGDDFDVVLESDHIHVEFQPKAPY